MGFFDYLMKGIGFETNDAQIEKQPKKVGEQDSELAQNNEVQSFDIPILEQPKVEEPIKPTSIKNVIVYNPKNQTELKTLIDFLRRRELIIVNFEFLPPAESDNMISFLSGALYALKSSLHQIAKNLYLITPDGISILTPKSE